MVLPHVLESHLDAHHDPARGRARAASRGPGRDFGLQLRSPCGDCGASSRGAARTLPGTARFIGLLRLKDWLQLLGFELNGGRFGCYAPPFAQPAWLRALRLHGEGGARWWPILGGVYVVRAVKRVHGMRVVTPTWRKERGAAPRGRRAAAEERHHRARGRDAGMTAAAWCAGLHRRRLQGQSRPRRLGRAAAAGRPREGAVRRRARHHQQPHGTDRRDPRARGAARTAADVSLYTDSQYVQKGISEWIASWKRRGWHTADKKPVKNDDLWKELDELARNHRVRLALGARTRRPSGERARRRARQQGRAGRIRLADCERGADGSLSGGAWRRVGLFIEHYVTA